MQVTTTIIRHILFLTKFFSHQPLNWVFESQHFHQTPRLDLTWAMRISQACCENNKIAIKIICVYIYIYISRVLRSNVEVSEIYRRRTDLRGSEREMTKRNAKADNRQKWMNNGKSKKQTRHFPPLEESHDESSPFSWLERKSLS